MNRDEPAAYRRRILLSVVGLTPQVVTETLFALARVRDPPFLPTEIHVVTTVEGRERVLLTLLDADTGALSRLAEDYNMDGVVEALTSERIAVVTNDAGEPLTDIVSDEDNTSAANVLTRVIRRLTEDPEAALHVSIAGGRKTMGFFAGYALSLFGRRQDRLSHVLVPAEFEAHPQFFYPPPKPRVLFTRDNRPVRTDAARISLADIPFVRLRHGLPRDLLGGAASYAGAVAGVQERLGPPEMVLDLSRRSITAGGRQIILPPVVFAWIVWLARRCKWAGPDAAAVHWADVDAEDFLAEYEQIEGARSSQVERARRSLATGMTHEYSEEKKARYNKLVRDALGGAAEPYCLHAFGRRPRTRVGLRLPAEAIRFLESPDAPS